ncbi:Lysozyme c-1 [Eumeta japonica]|uniref:lysozyme n=1 Tax=Eumeta variegata TaxID=151549 RepID=A0A4C1TS78_EUMVA|nr:Lysozyme c-1 [Eumeta japonica]
MNVVLDVNRSKLNRHRRLPVTSESGDNANAPRETSKNPHSLKGVRFDINNKEWCKKGRKGGHCSMRCEDNDGNAVLIADLLNEDLADDVRCAKRVYDRVGFKGWPSSYAYCKEKNLPDLSRC